MRSASRRFFVPMSPSCKSNVSNALFFGRLGTGCAIVRYSRSRLRPGPKRQAKTQKKSLDGLREGTLHF